VPVSSVILRQFASMYGSDVERLVSVVRNTSVTICVGPPEDRVPERIEVLKA
jgi:hypothetical protein